MKTDPTLVEAIITTPLPLNKYIVSGAKIPTKFVLQYRGRKSRVYALRDGTGDHLWIRNDKEQVFLDERTVRRLGRE